MLSLLQGPLDGADAAPGSAGKRLMGRPAGASVAAEGVKAHQHVLSGAGQIAGVVFAPDAGNPWIGAGSHGQAPGR